MDAVIGGILVPSKSMMHFLRSVSVAAIVCMPAAVYGQTAVAHMADQWASPPTHPPYTARAGIAPVPRGTSSATHFPDGITTVAVDSSHSSHGNRVHNVLIGALVGGASGFAVGLLMDHGSKSGGTGSGEHVTYSWEILTAPFGLLIGAVTGLLIPTH